MATQAHRAASDAGVGADAMTDQSHDPPGNGGAQSAAAQRMARFRKRKREGLQLLTILLREAEVDVLVRRGRLSNESRGDPAAIRNAVHSFLDDHLR
jgi:hypothetical protein